MANKHYTLKDDKERLQEMKLSYIMCIPQQRNEKKNQSTVRKEQLVFPSGEALV